MPARLRPTAPIAADAVLVGDPGRALMLAQALLEEPKMSNHARGLWGYWGRTAAGRPLSIQATGMGGPSAALVLADLAELGVRRAIRVGTCVAIEPEPEPGDLLTVNEAHAWAGGGAGAAVLPDAGLTARLREELSETTRPAIVASLDALHRGGRAEGVAYAERVDAADMQTATLFSVAKDLGLAIAAVLIVAESATGDQADDDRIEAAAKSGGAAATAALFHR
jgi:uridine phosphorylase